MNITRQDIDTAASWCDFDPEEDVRTDYIGRGMYGRTCIAYEGSNATAFLAAVVGAAIGRENGDVTIWDLVEELGQLTERSDSMGLGRITYWPGLQLAD
ncbi:hypothetical protein SEA_CAIB_76 [Gordonia phage CaiB]|nr:hypothetical protein SEA_CAIB_76 [Gordonia phage CaiB]